MMWWSVRMAVALSCLVTSPVVAALVEGVTTIDGHPGTGAVVYLEARNPLPPPPSGRTVMDQKNLAFAPSVLPVLRGTEIDFTNSDDVQHNVFSPSGSAGNFNLGTYGPGGTRTVRLNKPGDVIVLCNIHMEMEAHILVLDGPLFATVGADGRYRIDEVPPGTYTAKIWKGRWLAFSRVVEAPASGALSVDISATE